MNFFQVFGVDVIVRFTRLKAIQRGETFGDVQRRIAERWNRREGAQE